MPITKTKSINIGESKFCDVREFICARCVNSGLYTEEGFMGHYAITCKLLSVKRGEYEQIVEPDSPNQDGTLDFIVECNSFIEGKKIIL